MKKIVAISDLHGQLIEIPECDIFIIAGDLCPGLYDYQQASWLFDYFNPWMKFVPAKHKIYIAGNHDWAFQTYSQMGKELEGTYLYNSSVSIDGIKIYGSPFSPFYNNWAFNFPRKNKEVAKACWDLIPLDTQILVTHGPPKGYGDITTFGGRNHYGDNELLKAVKRVKPVYHFFGHFHEGCEGKDTIMEMKHLNGSRTLLCNVSVLNEKYILTKPCTIVEI